MNMKLSDIIDISTASIPIAGWVAIGQAIHKPWAHSGFIALGAVSAGLWVIKTLIQAKKKERFGGNRKRSKETKKENTSKKSIAQNHRKIKYEYKIPIYLREGKGFINRFEKRDIMIQTNSQTFGNSKRRW